MKTIERNYTRNPHTARFLQTFHSGIGSNGHNYREEMAMDDNQAEIELAAQDDLLDLVPTDVINDNRSAAQVRYMDSLISEITGLDAELGGAARTWTDKATASGVYWTAGREGTASAWISKLIDKVGALRVHAAAPVTTPAPAVEIPAGRYAVETDEIRCYTVDYGKAGTKWEGFTFLNRISSDDRFPVKNPAAKAEILAAIAADVTGSAILAGLTLRQCRRCGRELSDTKNPYFSVALGPDCGAK